VEMAAQAKHTAPDGGFVRAMLGSRRGPGL
jgi:hypothetical protein